jgi:ferredoxin
MKVTIDQHKCVSAGQCVMSAPEVFDQREDNGVVVLLTENPPTQLAGDLREAAMLCPALAIHIEE